MEISHFHSKIVLFVESFSIKQPCWLARFSITLMYFIIQGVDGKKCAKTANQNIPVFPRVLMKYHFDIQSTHLGLG